jgi:hypothetical protein
LAVSSERQKAISSQRAATQVRPRIVRNEAGRTWISISVDRLSVSDVELATRSMRSGAVSKIPLTKEKAFAACWVEAAMSGMTPRSPGARTFSVVDASRQICRQDSHSARFAAAASDDSPELLDRLQRLALAAREGSEDLALIIEQRLAGDRD